MQTHVFFSFTLVNTHGGCLKNVSGFDTMDVLSFEID